MYQYIMIEAKRQTADAGLEREVISSMRRGARLTQSDLAREVGLSQSMISLYESGQVNLRPDDLTKVRTVIAGAMPKGMGRLVGVDRSWEEYSEENRGEMEKDQLFA